MPTHSGNKLIFWLTLLLVYSSLSLWFGGIWLTKLMMANSSLYAFNLALSSLGWVKFSEIMPVVLLTFVIMAIGAVSATVTLTLFAKMGRVGNTLYSSPRQH